MTLKIAVVVVTYNRKALLERSLAALIGQTQKPDRIIVVDNASSDGTIDMLRKNGWLARDDIELLRLQDNTGGAGGFAAGIAHASAMSFDWIWIMDDDAIAQADALETLLDQPLDQSNVYGSVAVFGDKLSWPMLPLVDGRKKERIYDVADLPPSVEVLFIPFLGLLVSSAMVSEIGPPDGGFFIAADDVDYCLRARRHGARIILISSSRIEHPASESYQLRFPWGSFHALRLTPWKRYYDVRNRLFVARNHYGAAMYYKTIPGSFLRLLAALLHEQDRKGQLRAFLAGMVDGLLGRKGRRHEVWGLHP